MMSDKERKKRSTVELSGDEIGLLDELQAKLKLKSRSEVTRRAVSYVNQIVDLMESGHEIVARKEGQTDKLILPVGLFGPY